MLSLTSEDSYSKYYLEKKNKAKISLSNQKFEQQEEEMIEFKGEKQMEPNKFSSEHI